MAFSLRDWHPRHLLAAWSAYWAALAVVTLGPAARVIWPLLRDSNGRGSISASFGDASVHLVVMRSGAEVWAASTSVSAIAFWVGVPPLALWLLWLARRPRRMAVPASLQDQGDVASLGEGDIPLSDSKAQKQKSSVPRHP
jgi:hypothetical protein